MTKLICIVGATGNQGGSVARRFLQEPGYAVRGLTRNPDSAAAVELLKLGCEIVKAELEDADSLHRAFKGANIIFSVTNYWEPFFRPDCREKAAVQGISCREYAYNIEYRQGKNIADAAATVVDTLDANGFLASTLSSARNCSNGAHQELYHFDGKADIFPNYVEARYPELGAKMSCIHTGYFHSSYKLAPTSYFVKIGPDAYETRFTTDRDKSVPHFAVDADMGNFVFAVSQMPPRNSYMAAGTECSWTEYARLWSRVTGKVHDYKQVTEDKMIASTPDKEFGKELVDMFSYSSDPGYDGGDESLLKAADIEKAGIACPMTTLEAWMREEDWSTVFDKAVTG